MKIEKALLYRMNFNSQNFGYYSFLLSAGGGFHLAEAVSCVYAGPENGVMAANPLDIKEDIPGKETAVKTLKYYKAKRFIIKLGQASYKIKLCTNLRNA